MHGWLVSAKITRAEDLHPVMKKVVIPIRKVFDIANADMTGYIAMKTDLEVYIGVYMVITWFMGMSNLLGILLYWQILRIRYMLTTSMKQAFWRIDSNINQSVLPRMPALVSKGYGFVRQFVTSMGSLPDAAGQAHATNSLAGMLGHSMRKCTIF